MRRILIAAAVWLFGCAAALAQQTGPIYCGQSIQIASTGAATVKLVADPSGSAKVFVCGYTIVDGAAAATVQLLGGTGAACATALASTLTGIMPLPIGGILVESSSNFRGMETQPGAGLCLTVVGTGPVAGVLYYAQQ
jgi:hypothetical protein